MLARKQKPKPENPSSSAAPHLPGDWKKTANRWMQRLFGLEPNWYREFDVTKNNYRLGRQFFVRGEANDAILRFLMTTWLDARHTEAWYYLGRSYLMKNNRPKAVRALNKARELDSSHAGAQRVLTVIPAMYDTPTPKLATNEANAAEVATLAAIHREAFLKPWSEQSLAELFATAGTQAWIIGLPEMPMGMIVGRALGEQYEILTLAVSPDWRGRGLARKLLEALTTRAKETGAKSIFLEVAVDNVPARRFYEGAGYNAVSLRKDYYRNPDGTTTDAVVMSKELVLAEAAA